MLKLYSKRNCHLCDKAKAELSAICGLQFKEIDIYESDELLDKYGLMIPVVEYRDEIVQFGQVDKNYIQSFLKNKIIN